MSISQAYIPGVCVALYLSNIISSLVGSRFSTWTANRQTKIDEKKQMDDAVVPAGGLDGLMRCSHLSRQGHSSKPIQAL